MDLRSASGEVVVGVVDVEGIVVKVDMGLAVIEGVRRKDLGRLLKGKEEVHAGVIATWKFEH